MDIVVAACNDTTTIKEIKKILESHEGTTLTVYEKCGSKDYENIPLENVGREQHTFAHHIANNYDSLSDTIICTAGNFDKHPSRRKFLMDALADKTSDFVCNDNYVDQPRTLAGHTNFKIDHYGGRLKPANPRPLSKWSEQHIGAFDPKKSSCYEGMFKASSSSIRKRPQEDYMHIAKELSTDNNAEAVHYMERLQSMLYDPN